MTDQPGASSEFVQYDFGNNWWSFVEGHLTDERMTSAAIRGSAMSLSAGRPRND